MNGGVALGDRRAHQAGFHTGNVFFLLFLFFVLFLPRNLALLWRRRERLLDARLVAVLAASLALLLLSFRVEHPYNHEAAGLVQSVLLSSVLLAGIVRGAFAL